MQSFAFGSLALNGQTLGIDLNVALALQKVFALNPFAKMAPLAVC